MSWYYAGPEAKPVGPLSVEELHDRHVSGTVGPDTYVIEHTTTGAESLAWKRYKEVFPTNLAPTPPLPTVPAPIPALPTAQPHPLFPSAAPSAAYPSYYQPPRPTNGWCAWGFGIGLTGFFFSFACGTGLLLALPALLLSIVGLVQVRKNPQQEGQGLAIAGIVLSVIGVLVSLIFIVSMALPMIKSHELTVTEQTSNDSE
jgi:Domain of unknown function (DUF4190)